MKPNFCQVNNLVLQDLEIGQIHAALALLRIKVPGVSDEDL